MPVGIDENSGLTVSTPIEALLGPAQGRYFADGYRRVNYGIHELGPSSRQHLTGTAVVTYPLDWDVVYAGPRRIEHLSSVDALVLPLIMFERFGMLGDGIEDFRVRSVELRAGSEPWLNLDEVPLDIHLIDDEGPESIVLAGLVGNIRVRIVLNTHRAARTPRIPRVPGRKWTLYAGAYKEVEANTLVTDFDADTKSLFAGHVFSGNTSAALSPPGGLESSYWPSLTAIDYLVTLGQLTQVAIYAAAHTTRAEVGNLWMRSLRIDLDHPTVLLPTSMRSVTRVIRDRLVGAPERRLHDVHVTSQTSCGVSATATLAYESRL